MEQFLLNYFTFVYLVYSNTAYVSSLVHNVSHKMLKDKILTHSRMLLAMPKVMMLWDQHSWDLHLFTSLAHQKIWLERELYFKPFATFCAISNDSKNRTEWEVTRKANNCLFFESLKPAPTEMRAKLCVLPAAVKSPRPFHSCKVAREKVNSLVCADHEMQNSFLELSGGGLE